MSRWCRSAISPNERLQYRLHPCTSFVIVPLFALANVGIHIDGHLIGEAIASPITLGIVAGYVVGKPRATVVGPALVSRSVPRGIGRGLSWPVIAAGGVANGLGFTVSLLISSIAFRGQDLEEAKRGVLAAALIATGGAWVAVRITGLSQPRSARARSAARPTTSSISATTSIRLATTSAAAPALP